MRSPLWGGRIAAAEAHLITLIGEFDERGAWGGPGLLSCAHWLSWRLGMGLVAARERVRVAKRLRDLPLTAAAFAQGQLSWTQARAITRVTDPSLEQQLVDLARLTTGAQLERVVRALVRNEQDRADAADPEAAAYRMRSTTRWDQHDTLVLTLRIPAADAQLALDALERFKAEIQAERDKARAELDASAEARPEILKLRAEYLQWNAQKNRDAAVRARAEATGAILRSATLGGALVRMASTSPPRTAGAPAWTSWSTRSRAGPAPATGSYSRPAASPSSPGPCAQGPHRDHPPPARLRPHPTRPPAQQPPGQPRPSQPPRHPRRRALPLPRLHPRPQSPRPPRPLLGPRRPHRPGQPRPGLRTPHTLIHSQGFQLTLNDDRALHVQTQAGVDVPHRHAPAFGHPAAIDPAGRINSTTLPPHGGEKMDLTFVVGVMLQHVA